MTYMVLVNDESSRYKYNVWEVFQYEDGSVSKDARIFESDDAEEFVAFCQTLPSRPNTVRSDSTEL